MNHGGHREHRGRNVKHILPLFVVLICFLASPDPARCSGLVGVESSRYVQLYEKIAASESASFAKAGAAEKLWLAGVAARLAQKTGRVEYREKAVALLESALPEVAGSPSDFHSLRATALAILPMRQLGLIKPEHEKALRPIAMRAWKEFLSSPAGTVEGDVDHNIRLAQALACAGFVRFFQADKTVDASAIRQRLENYWSKIKATGDLDEDSSNYTGLGIVHCLELARTLGHEDDFRAPGFRRMFERQRDIISPTGMVPEFGDGFFSPQREAFDFLTICEYAAKLYDDPTYLTVARHLYDPASFAAAKPDNWGRGILLLDLDLSSGTPVPLASPSLVNYRANRVRPQPVVDKLILRTGNEPGDAMVLMDLYAAGSHSHIFLGPSVGYYEAAGVPLFHNLGRRRTSSAITGNIFWALPASQTFPGIWKPDEWFTMTIPAEMMFRDVSGNLGIGDRIFFRNFNNPGTRRLWLDNLRLVGKAGVKLLDGFESEKGWEPELLKQSGVRVETSSDHTQGTSSQCLNWSALKGSCTRMLADSNALTFRSEDYDKIQLDLKYTGIRPYFHLRRLCEQMDVGDQALINSVGSAKVEQRGHDAYGEVVFSRYIACDAKLTRRIVLTAEGCLIIHDRWTAGTSEEKWTAGQLWQFYAIKDQGTDWFCGDDDGSFAVPNGHGHSTSVTRRMLVKFAAPAGTSTFKEEVVQPCLAPNFKSRPQDRFFTTGSKRLVTAGEEITCTMVVIPHQPDQNPQSLAEAVRFEAHADRTDVVLRPPGASADVRVSFGNSGTWQVSRSP